MLTITNLLILIVVWLSCGMICRAMANDLNKNNKQIKQ